MEAIELVELVRGLDTTGLQLADVLLAVGLLVTAATGLVASLLVAVPALEWLASLTATQYDDLQVGKLEHALDSAADWLRTARSVLERVSLIRAPRG